ncbi:MAG: galactokinase [Bryobacteraceae bacterium]|nr:galactokinase [Bryobacteraceae bacterium]
MVITRTPLRISIGGGGTDLPSYYEQFGGCVISAAISQYIFVSVNRMFSEGYLLKYSALENPKHVDQIEHPILREALRRHNGGGHIEIASLADVPSGTGLGSSGTFTVGLLKALYAFKRESATDQDLAEEACEIEIKLLNRAVGKQDQYIAAFGGLTCFDFQPDGKVDVKPLRISDDTLLDLEHNLLMFFTGHSRSSISVLTDQHERSTRGDREMIENLHFTKQLGLLSKAALEDGQTARYAELMNEHWRHKRVRSQGMSNEQINHWYEAGMNNGALGGKLVGAGGGGYLLFYAEDPMRVRRAMAAEGLQELRFRFDHDGSTVLVRD